MIPALTLDDIRKECKEKYEEGERRIIAVMVARYTDENSQQMIQHQYEYWHYWSRNRFIMFWLGYGGYNSNPDKPGQYLLGNIGEVPSVYFDHKVFVEGVEELTQVSGLRRGDNIGILLCNYYGGEVHFDESAYFNIDYMTNKKNREMLHRFSIDLMDKCAKNESVTEVVKSLRIESVVYRLMDIRITETLFNAITGLL